MTRVVAINCHALFDDDIVLHQFLMMCRYRSIAASRRRRVSDIVCMPKSQEVWFTRLVTGIPAVQRKISFSLVLVKSFIDLASTASPLVAPCIVRYKRIRTTNYRKGGFVRTPRTPLATPFIWMHMHTPTHTHTHKEFIRAMKSRTTRGLEKVCVCVCGGGGCVCHALWVCTCHASCVFMCFVHTSLTPSPPSSHKHRVYKANSFLL